jgi:hypothetical protein
LKRAISYVPIVLSLLVLGAHFLRDGNSLGVLAAALLVLVLFVRRPWAARLVQVTLVLGTIEWVHTLYAMTQLRMAFGQPYTRLVLILAAVIAVSLASALLFQSKELKKIYRL